MKGRILPKKAALTPYLFMLPTLLTLLVFSLYPLVSGIVYSFTDIKYVGGAAHWVGLRNFSELFTGTIGTSKFFLQAYGQTFLWTACTIAGQLILGYITALLLNGRFPGQRLLMILIMLPWAVPSVVMALNWQWMYDPFYGVINHYLKAAGVIREFRTWVGQPNSTIWPMIVVSVWRGLPFMTLMLLSGLQSIPNEHYEAARLDGANAVMSFFHVTLPAMRTITVIVLMLTTMWWWNSFDIQKILSPVMSLGYNAATLPILAWFEAFQWKHLGSGAAISVVSMITLLAFIVVNARREMKSVKE